MSSVSGLGGYYTPRYTARYNNNYYNYQNPVVTGGVSQNVQAAEDKFVTIAGETCTDGEDNGRIGFWGALGNTLKGIWNAGKNMVKSAVEHPIRTALMIGACCIPVVGPILGAGLAAYGVAKGVMTIGQGIAIANSATSDAEAKLAWQNVGNGALTTGVSVIGLKASAGALRGQLTGGSATVNAIRNHASIGEIGRTAVAETGSNMLGILKAIKTKGENLYNNTKSFGQHLGEAFKKNMTMGDRWAAVKNAFKGTNTYQNVAGKVNKVKTKVKEGYRKAQEKCDTTKIAERQQTITAQQKKAIADGKKPGATVEETYSNGVPKEVKFKTVTRKYNSNGELISQTRNGVTTTYKNGEEIEQTTVTKKGTTTKYHTTKGKVEKQGYTVENTEGNVVESSEITTNSKTGVTSTRYKADGQGATYTQRSNMRTKSSVSNSGGNRSYVFNGKAATTWYDRALARIDSTKVGTFAQSGQGHLGRYYFGTLLLGNNN